MRFLLALLPLLVVAGPAWSDQAVLVPPDSVIELRSYGFGLIPLDGKFTRFHGLMRYDPLHPDACEVVLEIEAGSLVMSSETIRDRITGPEMMDVARFPALAFHGACRGDTVAGDLTLHGETHPLTMEYTRSAGIVTATGLVRRADWGITGSPLVGGPVIRIRVILPDPFKAQHI